jgi:hypothetical protein
MNKPEPDLFLAAVREKPIYKLSLAEIDLLPEDDRRLAVGLLLDMARDGDLAMFAVNPPGTRYEVTADREHGWKLQPLCTCPRDQPDFIEAYRDYRPELFVDGQ